MDKDIYLPPSTPTKSLTAEENLLVQFNLQDVYKEISNNQSEPTFRGKFLTSIETDSKIIAI